MNHLASCSPHVLDCSNSLNKQQSSLQATGRKGVQFKLEFELHKLIEPLKSMLPDLFANDLYIADNLQHYSIMMTSLVMMSLVVLVVTPGVIRRVIPLTMMAM